MKAGQRCGLLSPASRNTGLQVGPSGPLVAATLASAFPLGLWKQTDQKLTCQKNQEATSSGN